MTTALEIATMIRQAVGEGYTPDEHRLAVDRIFQDVGLHLSRSPKCEDCGSKELWEEIWCRGKQFCSIDCLASWHQAHTCGDCDGWGTRITGGPGPENEVESRCGTCRGLGFFED